MTTRSISRRFAALLTTVALVLGACGAESGADATGGAATVFDPSYVHEISLTFDQAEYDEIVEIYAETGEKDWISATVTIDGTTYEDVGIRLKGNSSLRGLGESQSDGGPGGRADADEPEELPWLIRLDKYVDGQSHDGIVDLVVRSNNSETALNEAIALEVLELAGLATQQAIAVAFSVNGSDPTLRLVIEHPEDVWMAETFDADGALYKAESTGDYRYRGDDPDAYDEVFDQEAGDDNADLTPLIAFLRFLDESDGATFAAELGEWLDIDAFATYLAVQDLIDNFDDIDGPGNNSYLYYDTDTDVFTVVAWDHNLAFGALGNRGLAGGDGFAGGEGIPPAGGEDGFQPPEGAPGGGFAGGERPAAGELPEGGPPAGGEDGFEPPEGALGGGFGADGGPAGGPALGNVLRDRFLAVDEFAALYEAQLAELEASLYESGAVADVLEAWVEVLSTTDLVDTATVEAEAASIAAYLEG
ncbi:MAG: CotH kinase family protein [Acidimicrobiia bacterium]|nr:CotH kinase family protein [Acidimicrobiia bacterium]